VRQLRLRDVGGIVVIDFIDMVLESNRELVLRRLTECLGRDRTKHQVAEVTSLGLVQMTRKRVGEGLLEAFSEPCEVCKGRGVIIHTEPVDQTDAAPEGDTERPKGKQRRSKASKATPPEEPPATPEQRQAASAAIAAIHRAAALEQAAADAGSSVEDLPEETVEQILAASVDEPADGAVGPDDSLRAGRSDEPAEVGAVTEPGATPEPSGDGAPAPRRRRRAAVRPAGPPMTSASA
jgi:ribonuclease E